VLCDIAREYSAAILLPAGAIGRAIWNLHAPALCPGMEPYMESLSCRIGPCSRDDRCSRLRAWENIQIRSTVLQAGHLAEEGLRNHRRHGAGQTSAQDCSPRDGSGLGILACALHGHLLILLTPALLLFIKWASIHQFHSTHPVVFCSALTIPKMQAKLMSSRPYPITDLSASVSLQAAIAAHWTEYLMEAAELGALMLGICMSGTLFYSSASPLAGLGLPRSSKAVLMGSCVAATTFLIIRSPFGRRSGAHFNPAITLTYLWLGRIHRWDALCYVVAQFCGALAGVFAARQILGTHLSAAPVQYVVTTPGTYGNATAFMAEYLLSVVLMAVVLFATNHRILARFSPLLVALLTVFYYTICSSIAGFSVNPARSFSSAFFARLWWGVWIYFIAPSLGMLTAAAIYITAAGPEKVYCAKVFHDLHSPCPFPCRLRELYRDTEH